MYTSMRVFPKIGVPQNGWFIMENPIQMHDLGVPLFWKHPCQSSMIKVSFDHNLQLGVYTNPLKMKQNVKQHVPGNSAGDLFGDG